MIPELGNFALILALCLTLALSSLDRYQCWERIEALGAAQA